MTAQVARLREILVTDLTLVGPLRGMLAEVVSQVAALAMRTQQQLQQPFAQHNQQVVEADDFRFEIEVRAKTYT